MKWFFAGVISLFMVGNGFGQEGDRVWVFNEMVYTAAEDDQIRIGTVAKVENPAGGFELVYSLSPDGQSMLYIGGERERLSLRIYHYGELASRELPPYGIADYLTDPVWSPDGTRAAYSIDGRIWVYERDGEQVYIVSEPADRTLVDIEPLFSDDGQEILFYRVSLAAGEISGQRYGISLDGTNFRNIIEEVPKYPANGDPSNSFDYFEIKIAHLIEDINRHRYSRIITSFSPDYVYAQFEFLGLLGLPLKLEGFNTFFFNGAVIYDDYRNQISSLEEIEEVIDYFIDEKESALHISARLSNGRVIGFSLLFSPETLFLWGPAG